MRSLVLDELTPREAAAAQAYLAAQAEFSGVEGLYWLGLPPDLWGCRQIQAHQNGMAESYRLAVEAGPKWVRFELLVRSETLVNHGGAQATPGQVLYILDWADRMARELGLITCADPALKEATPAASEKVNT
jgi:hypothetical protein